MKIKKAIFPVAGLGTRFLPATKATPKEMLPIVDTPLIQYAVKEAIDAGITDLIFVTSSSKRAIEDHFDSNYELEKKLLERNKTDLLKIVQGVLPKGINCAYVRQKEQLGLGHAVLCAESLIAGEPFAVLLADDLIDATEQGCLAQMVDKFNELQHSIIAVQEVDKEDVDKYGIVNTDSANTVAAVQSIVEKPNLNEATSNLGVVGRYILTPKIFELLRTATPGSGGEIQLTDSISKLLEQEDVAALKFDGVRYDCGSKLGYLQATVAFALKHKELADDFREYLKQYIL